MSKIKCATYNKSLDFSKGIESFAKSLSELYNSSAKLLTKIYTQDYLNNDDLTDLLVDFLNTKGINTKRLTQKDKLSSGNNSPIYKIEDLLHIDTLSVNNIGDLIKELKPYIPEAEKNMIDFMASTFGTVNDINVPLDDLFNETKSKIETPVKTVRTSKRKPVIFAAPGLGKTYLANLVKGGEYVDADEIAIKLIKELTGKDVSPVEASTMLGQSSMIPKKFKERIAEINKTKTILSSMDASKLGIAYDKFYTPSEEILDKVIDKIATRIEFPFKITKEKYKELYMDKYPGSIKVDNTLAETFGEEEQEYRESLSSYLLNSITDLPLTFSKNKVLTGTKRLTSRLAKYRSGFYVLDGKHFSVHSLTNEAMSFADTLEYLKDLGYLSEENTREDYFRMFGVQEDELDATNDSFQNYINWVNGKGVRYTYDISPVSALFTLGSETLDESNIEEAANKLMKIKVKERLDQRIKDLFKALRNALTINSEDSLTVQSIKSKLELYRKYKQELNDNPDTDLIDLMLTDLINYEVKDYSDVEFLTQEHMYLKTLMELDESEPSEARLKLLSLLQEYINKENIIQSNKLFKEEYGKDFDDITPIDDISVMKNQFISFRESRNEILQLIGQKVNKGISEIQDAVNKFVKEKNRLMENLKKNAPNAVKDQSWMIDKEKGTYFTQYETGTFRKIKEAKDQFSFSELNDLVDITVKDSLTDIKQKRTEITTDHFNDILSAIKDEIKDTEDPAIFNRIASSLFDKNLISEINNLVSNLGTTPTDTQLEEIRDKIIKGKEDQFALNLSNELKRVETIYNAVQNGTLESVITNEKMEKTFFFTLSMYNQKVKSSFQTKEYLDLYNDNSLEGKAKQEWYEFFTDYIKSAEVTEKLPYGMLPSYYKTQSVFKVGSYIDNMKRSLQEKEDKVIHVYNKVTGMIEQDFAIQGLNRMPIEDMDMDMFSLIEKFSESLNNAIVRNKYKNDLSAAKSLLKRQVAIRRDKWGKPLNVENDDKQLTTAIKAADSVIESFLYGMYKDVDTVFDSGRLSRKEEIKVKELTKEFNDLNFTDEEKKRIADAKNGVSVALSPREQSGFDLFNEISNIQEGSEAITGRKVTDSLLSFTTLLRLGFAPLGALTESMQAFMGALIEGKSSVIKLNDITTYLKTKLTGSNKEFNKKMEWVTKQFVMESFLKGGVENNKMMEQALMFYKIPNDVFNSAYLYSFLKNKQYNGKSLWELIDTNGDSFKWSDDSGIMDGENYTDNKYTYQEEFRAILRKTRERQQSTDPIESNKKFWGRLLNQFKGTWLYEGIHYRYGQGTELYLGKIDGVQQYKNTEGFYRTAFNALSTPETEELNLLGELTPTKSNTLYRTYQTVSRLFKIATWDKVMGNDYTANYGITPEAKENVEKAITDIRIKLVILMMVSTVFILSGDDKRKKKKAASAYKFAFNTLMRLNSDANIYTSPSSFMSTIKNAIPAMGTVQQVSKLLVTDTYKTLLGNPYYYAGTKRETLRYYNDVKKLIPLVTTYENLEQFLTEKAKNY